MPQDPPIPAGADYPKTPEEYTIYVGSAGGGKTAQLAQSIRAAGNAAFGVISPTRVAEHVAVLMERAWTSAERDLFTQALVRRVPQVRIYESQPNDPDDIAMHTHITDGLPDGHSLRDQHVSCGKCGELVHAADNECMQTWFEFRGSILCSACLKGIPGLYAIDAEEFTRHALDG